MIIPIPFHSRFPIYQSQGLVGYEFSISSTSYFALASVAAAHSDRSHVTRMRQACGPGPGHFAWPISLPLTFPAGIKHQGFDRPFAVLPPPAAFNYYCSPGTTPILSTYVHRIRLDQRRVEPNRAWHNDEITPGPEGGSLQAI